MEDERNLLFERYAQVLAALKPDGYLFENVTGILNMEKGEVFRLIRQKLACQGYTTTLWTLGAEDYGVPQRRSRVFLVGLRPGRPRCLPPPAITSISRSDSLFQLPPAVTVREALDDLPPLSPGEDGSQKDYLGPPRNPYQAFLRGALTAADLVNRLKEG
jgi:DNA (cytosine-5)-methyltransferase 1